MNKITSNPTKGLSSLQKDLMAWIFARTHIKHPSITWSDVSDMTFEEYDKQFPVKESQYCPGQVVFAPAGNNYGGYTWDFEWQRPGNSNRARSRALKRLEARGLLWRGMNVDKNHTLSVTLTPTGLQLARELGDRSQTPPTASEIKQHKAARIAEILEMANRVRADDPILAGQLRILSEEIY